MERRMGISAVGIPWYKRSDYARILEVMEDRDKLPLTFDKWQSKAEQIERQTRTAGKIVARAYIDPDHFVAWCAANGLHIDSHARGMWASEVARDAFTGDRAQ